MQKVKQQLLLRKDDYHIMMTCLRGGTGKNYFDRQNAEELEAELKKATLINKEEFPEDVIGLNSTVIIKDETAKKEMEVKLVLPESADIKQRKISVMSPIGTALIGFRKGQQVQWNVPAGTRTFTIIDVRN